MTKRELIQFMDELVELASEENKSRAILVKEKFINDFERSYVDCQHFFRQLF